MTILFSGHISNTTANGPHGTIRVTLVLPCSAGDEPLTIFVPKEQAKEWVAGNYYQCTIYAYSPPEPTA